MLWNWYTHIKLFIFGTSANSAVHAAWVQAFAAVISLFVVLRIGRMQSRITASQNMLMMQQNDMLEEQTTREQQHEQLLYETIKRVVSDKLLMTAGALELGVHNDNWSRAEMESFVMPVPFVEMARYLDSGIVQDIQKQMGLAVAVQNALRITELSLGQDQVDLTKDVIQSLEKIAERVKND